MVLVDPLQEKNNSGVIIPDMMEKQPNKGEVVAVAEGILDVSPGDKVQWKELSGTYIDELILVDINDILLKF